MTIYLKRVLLTLVSGSALTLAPLTYATVVPAVGHADECTDAQRSGAGDGGPCGTDPKGLTCPDGTVVDEQNDQCVDLMSGIGKQLQTLPSLPTGDLGLPGGIPSLGTVNLPDLVLPGVGLGLVPNLNVNLQPQLPSLPPLNPQNPLGLPPPPSIPFL